MIERIAIAAGGTAGHVRPGLAVAEACRARNPDADVLFLGTANGIETRLVPPLGYRLAAIPGAPLFGVGLAGKARAVTGLVRGTAAARALLREHRTEIVIGFGGYAAAGAIVAARTLGIPSAVHEANAVSGVANRLLGRFADRVLLGFEAAAPAFAPGKTVVTGLPVERAFATLPAPQVRADPATFRVLVTGGSGGSAFLNARVPALLARVAHGDVRLAVRHQTGARDLATVRTAYRDAGLDASVSAYIDDMREAYQATDFAITCAGAGTLAELALTGVPALLVPLATAALDHQRENARAWEALTGCQWTTEDAYHEDGLVDALSSLVRSPNDVADAARRMRAAARPDAADTVVDTLEQLCR